MREKMSNKQNQSIKREKVFQQFVLGHLVQISSSTISIRVSPLSAKHIVCFWDAVEEEQGSTSVFVPLIFV